MVFGRGRVPLASENTRASLGQLSPSPGNKPPIYDGVMLGGFLIRDGGGGVWGGL